MASLPSGNISAPLSVQVENRHTVFISYSRRDKAFVQTLVAAFQKINRDPWIDWEDINKGEEWWQAIQRGIEAAQTFVFVVTPDSVASAVCRDEIEYAAQCHKRFLPIVRREGFDFGKLHPAISSHNWLFFRETDDFDTSFAELIKAMDTDLDHVRAHTRLLLRSLEWQDKSQNSSYLLRGSDLQDAEQWLLRGVGKSPQPTELQIAYITASRTATLAIQKSRQRARWVVVLTIVLANMAIATAGSIWFYGFANNWARQRISEKLLHAMQVGLIGINGDEFAQLKNVQGNPNLNPLYMQHQNWLLSVRTVFPNAYLRSYTRSRDSGEILWIGDLTRNLESGAADSQFRQSSVAQPAELMVYDGQMEEAVTSDIYKDEFGSWISAYGPIRDSQGAIVGGLRVDFRKDYVLQQLQQVRQLLIVIYLVLFAWLIALSLVILKVTQPPSAD